MKCKKCLRNIKDNIIVNIIDRNGVKSYCPNCLSFELQTHNLNIAEDINLDCDITRQPGAVIYKSGDELYVLNKKSMLRLLSYNLTPDEYKILKDKAGDKFMYMLHDDFYTEDGEALQPIEI